MTRFVATGNRNAPSYRRFLRTVSTEAQSADPAVSVRCWVGGRAMSAYAGHMARTSDSPRFVTTQWQLVRACDREQAGVVTARAAIAKLCARYWFPIYAFIRGRGYSISDAEDLTQGFLTSMIESNGLAGADRDRGRFRSYLLGAVKHFLSHERERATSLKRGGGKRLVEFDAMKAEARYAIEPQCEDDLDVNFNRLWPGRGQSGGSPDAGAVPRDRSGVDRRHRLRAVRGRRGMATVARRIAVVTKSNVIGFRHARLPL